MAPLRAVLWDFGGVLTHSPFEAFSRFEASRGLPQGFLRSINSTNPDRNAWARFERGESSLEQFDAAFEAETRTAGHAVRGVDAIRLLYGELRPAMVEAVRRCGERYLTACLTNNVKTDVAHGLPTTAERAAQVSKALSLFDFVIESSKVGARKPEPRFYALALERIGVAPHEVVFLDDLGVNLKPAKAMGMITIKVESERQALQELERIVHIPLLDVVKPV